MTSYSGLLRSGFYGSVTAEDDQVGERDLFAGALKSFWIPSSVLRTFSRTRGWLTSQPFCGSRRMRPPFAPPRLSEPRKDAAAAHAVETSCEVERPEARIFALSAAMSASPMSS